MARTSRRVEHGPLIDSDTIRAKVEELGTQISRDYSGDHRLLLVAILRGSVVFLADLCRAISVPVEIDFMAISSYGAGTQSTGVVRIVQDLETDITDRDILVVEDIVDTGRTLDYLLRNLSTRNPRSLRVCALLDKRSRRKIDVPLSYVGFSIPDEFVIGYGMDLDGQYRNLPYVASFKSPEAS